MAVSFDDFIKKIKSPEFENNELYNEWIMTKVQMIMKLGSEFKREEIKEIDIDVFYLGYNQLLKQAEDRVRNNVVRRNEETYLSMFKRGSKSYYLLQPIKSSNKIKTQKAKPIKLNTFRGLKKQQQTKFKKEVVHPEHKENKRQRKLIDLGPGWIDDNPFDMLSVEEDGYFRLSENNIPHQPKVKRIQFNKKVELSASTTHFVGFDEVKVLKIPDVPQKCIAANMFIQMMNPHINEFKDKVYSRAPIDNYHRDPLKSSFEVLQMITTSSMGLRSYDPSRSSDIATMMLVIGTHGMNCPAELGGFRKFGNQLKCLNSYLCSITGVYLAPFEYELEDEFRV